MKDIQENIRQRLSTEEEPYEGEVPIGDIEKDIIEIIETTKAKSDSRIIFIFDGYIHSSGEEFA